MDATKQQIAIAEACGKSLGSDCWYNQCGESEFEHRNDCPCNGTGWNIPDYINDLNAMHEAVLTLPENLRRRYCINLGIVCGNEQLENYDQEWHRINATATQCAEAFLRTIGKWEGA
jgi:hypothetical protein